MSGPVTRVRPMRRRAPTSCLACRSYKHTQCDRLLEDDAKCTCQCYTENGPAWWALVETARHWPEVAAAHAVIARSLRICWSR